MTFIRKWFFASVIGIASLLPRDVSAGIILWYNGDAGGGATTNEHADSPVGAISTFDDFVVTATAGWTIGTVWSNNEMDLTGIAEAAWQIRSGVSVGHEGTLVAGGIAAATQTATGRTGVIPGAAEYKIEISGLNVFLAPGIYWLSVSPVVGYDDRSDGYFRSYNSMTYGLNAINRPPSAVGNGLLNAAYFTYDFKEVEADHSMGVSGVVGVSTVPEPSSLPLAIVAGLSVLGHSVCRRRRR